MERTVSHFNEEVDGILESIKSRTQNQHYKLSILRGDDPIKNALNKDEERLTEASSDTDKDEKTDGDKEENKKSKFSFLKRKKKK